MKPSLEEKEEAVPSPMERERVPSPSHICYVDLILRLMAHCTGSIRSSSPKWQNTSKQSTCPAGSALVPPAPRSNQVQISPVRPSGLDRS